MSYGVMCLWQYPSDVTWYVCDAPCYERDAGGMDMILSDMNVNLYETNDMWRLICRDMGVMRVQCVWCKRDMAWYECDMKVMWLDMDVPWTWFWYDIKEMMWLDTSITHLTPYSYHTNVTAHHCHHTSHILSIPGTPQVITPISLRHHIKSL